MLVSRLLTLSLSLTLAACGPQPNPADTASSSTAASSSTGVPTTGGATGTSDTTLGSSTGEPTSSTSSGRTTSASTTDDTGTTTGDDSSLCNGSTCDESEHCTPEARQNADITGTTPLGPFSGTFAFASAALAFSELGVVRVIPTYGANICIAAPMLRIEFVSGTTDGDFLTEASISIEDSEGQVVQTTATVQIRNCCQFLWFCECQNPAPYEIEIDVAGDGWSLAGTARPNCCRSYSIDEAA